MSENRTDVAVKELYTAVRADWDEWAEQSPRNQRLKAIAIEICQANRADPDQIVMGIEGCPSAVGGKNLPVVCHPIQTAWASYLLDAEGALMAVEGADQKLEKVS